MSELGLPSPDLRSVISSTIMSITPVAVLFENSYDETSQLLPERLLDMNTLSSDVTSSTPFIARNNIGDFHNGVMVPRFVSLSYFAATIILNVMTIVAVQKKNTTRKGFKIYVQHMCFSYVFFTLVQLIMMRTFSWEKVHDHPLCYLYFGLIVFLYYLLTFQVTCLSVDRWAVVHLKLRYQRMSSVKVASSMVAIIWILSIVSTVLTLGWGFRSGPCLFAFILHTSGQWIIAFIILSCSTVNLVTSVSVARAIRQRRRVVGIDGSTHAPNSGCLPLSGKDKTISNSKSCPCPVSARLWRCCWPSQVTSDNTTSTTLPSQDPTCFNTIQGTSVISTVDAPVKISIISPTPCSSEEEQRENKSGARFSFTQIATPIKDNSSLSGMLSTIRNGIGTPEDIRLSLDCSRLHSGDVRDGGMSHSAVPEELRSSPQYLWKCLRTAKEASTKCSKSYRSRLARSTSHKINKAPGSRLTTGKERCKFVGVSEISLSTEMSENRKSYLPHAFLAKRDSVGTDKKAFSEHKPLEDIENRCKVTSRSTLASTQQHNTHETKRTLDSIKLLKRRASLTCDYKLCEHTRTKEKYWRRIHDNKSPEVCECMCGRIHNTEQVTRVKPVPTSNNIDTHPFTIATLLAGESHFASPAPISFIKDQSPTHGNETRPKLSGDVENPFPRDFMASSYRSPQRGSVYNTRYKQNSLYQPHVGETEETHDSYKVATAPTTSGKLLTRADSCIILNLQNPGNVYKKLVVQTKYQQKSNGASMPIFTTRNESHSQPEIPMIPSKGIEFPSTFHATTEKRQEPTKPKHSPPQAVQQSTTRYDIFKTGTSSTAYACDMQNELHVKRLQNTTRLLLREQGIPVSSTTDTEVLNATLTDASARNKVTPIPCRRRPNPSLRGPPPKIHPIIDPVRQRLFVTTILIAIWHVLAYFPVGVYFLLLGVSSLTPGAQSLVVVWTNNQNVIFVIGPVVSCIINPLLYCWRFLKMPCCKSRSSHA